MLWDREKITVAIQESNQITVLQEAELITEGKATALKAKVKEDVAKYLEEVLED